MDRRAFSRLSASALAGLALPHPALAFQRGAAQELRVDGARLNARLQELAAFGRDAEGGNMRVAFSDADLEARAWYADLLRGAGLRTRVDEAGNLWGRREGTEPGLPPLVTGSHLDAVPGGGHYDGQVGAMGALEVAWTLADADIATRHPVEVVVFPNEEGGKTGSRALVGQVEPFELDLETASGYTIGEGLRRIGGDPDRLDAARMAPGDVASFLELHVEQGAVLDADGIDIGVVEGIVGIMRWEVVVEGDTNHAGTTPMPRRQDALVAASRFVDAVHRTALEMPGRQVATVGRLAVEPGAPNVIPGRVVLSLEVRDLSMEGIEAVYEAVRERADGIAGETGTTFSFSRFYLSEAAPTHPIIRDVVEAQARARGLSTLRMPSGAGHDAQSMAKIGPVGMIFVPSRDGISHDSRELTDAEDVTRGTDVLLGTLLALDRLDPGPA